MISLPRREDRRKHVQSQFKNIPTLSYEFFDAIDGKQLTIEAIRQLCNKSINLKLSRAEIGCAASHISVYKKIVQENLPFALIMEDDFVITENFNRIIAEIKNFVSAQKKPTIILLNANHGTRYFRKSIVKIGRYGLHKTLAARRAEGYIINQSAALYFSDILSPIKYEADYWSYFIYKYSQVQYISCIPHLVEQNARNLNSDIEHERIKYEKKGTRSLREINFKKLTYQIKRHLLIYFFFLVKKYK